MVAWSIPWALTTVRTAMKAFCRFCLQKRFQEKEEAWQHLVQSIALPEDRKRNFSATGRLFKEQISAKDLSRRIAKPEVELGRILRCPPQTGRCVARAFISWKTAFDLETIGAISIITGAARCMSSLSPCVHAILAAKLGDEGRHQFTCVLPARTLMIIITIQDSCHTTSWQAPG